MSVQLVAPHSVASKAMNSTSLRSCNALSARGSGRSAKQVAKLFIDGSFLDRNHLLNPFCQLEQQLTHPNMRFPCPSYGGGKDGRDKLFIQNEQSLFAGVSCGEWSREWPLTFRGGVLSSW